MAIYSRAYPGQPLNEELRKTAEELVVPKEESESIPDQTVIGVLEMFGNSDLAEAVYEAIAQRPSR
jgi:hypothetical protein